MKFYDRISYKMVNIWNYAQQTLCLQCIIIELDVVAESLDKKYLLVGECKWIAGENSDHLLAELIAKTEKLPFVKGYTIVPKLFLKQAPAGTTENVLLPEDVIKMQ